MVKLAVLVDALNIESGAIDAGGRVVDAARLIDDIRTLRGRTDLLDMPRHAPADGAMAAAKTPDAPEHDSCRVGSLAVSEPVTVEAIWQAARCSYNGATTAAAASTSPFRTRARAGPYVSRIQHDRARPRRHDARDARPPGWLQFFDAHGPS